ncbi:DNA-directed RNA polymerase subunit omega [Anaerobacillus isosaccharinicus]|uniref:DNA-directed RNA polymerase subunit omega n=1 Tax=Anaerobacillus isosaccharinicus TaxID=1532552 RepID=A0A1S2M783_9BACI|nr:DNA-directed RNA polymerase subunit omega [Anaerobacillus isosaccharinicus]MBA5587397.1 DNA-directed RNA polymerase subunit omega [Anaerobacillus isosaccharinicus]QOY34412.1 DNA-directed RNA polymerase subunit omega [Anaerobacillus isosaccharinicus]
MLYPSIDNLLTKLDSKYTLVTVSSKRARYLKESNERDLMVVKPTSYKQVGKALEEISSGQLSFKRREEI